MRPIVALVAVVLAATACVSKSEHDRQLDRLAALSAEKDSLLSEVVATSQFISEVTTEIDRVRTGQPLVARAGELETLSPAETREQLVTRVRALTARVQDADARLAQSRRRIAALTAGNAALVQRYDSTLATFQALIDTQKAEIDALGQQVGTLRLENTQLRDANVQLVADRASLIADRDSLLAEHHVVYWVAGKRDELVRRGIIEQRGGMLGIGRTPVLARTLDADDFTALDRREVTVISLPDPNKTYRIISPNDMAGLDTTPPGAKFKGELRIESPETFWRPSRFLVLVEQ